MIGLLGTRPVGPIDPISSDAARRAAREELRRAEYHRSDPDVLQRVARWIGRTLSRSVDGTPSGTVLLVLLIIGAAIGVLVLVKAGPLRREARRASGAELADPLQALDSAAHRQRAAELERAGDLRGALREWLRAAVAVVEERGVLLPRPGRTGAALAREAGPVLPDAAAALTTATTAFDEVWFGGRDATREDVAAARTAADAVVAARVGRAVAPAGYTVPA